MAVAYAAATMACEQPHIVSSGRRHSILRWRASRIGRWCRHHGAIDARFLASGHEGTVSPESWRDTGRGETGTATSLGPTGPMRRDEGAPVGMAPISDPQVVVAGS
jgi:hypothetical protein